MTIQQPWPLIKGVGRMWPGQTAEGMFYMQCHYCLGIFQSRDRRRCYCSKQCRNAMHNAARRQSQPGMIECPICHRRFTARQHNQRWCSPQCRKRAWHRKRHGLPVDPLAGLHATDPFQRYPTGTKPQREQRRAQNLRNRRYQRDDERQAREGLKLHQHHVGILDAHQPLPEDLVRRITETLADQTSETTE